MDRYIAYHDNINITNETDKKQFVIQKLDYSTTDKKIFKQPLHRHSYFEILLIIDGMITIEVDFKTYELKSGTIFLFSPLQVHHPQKVSEDYKAYLIRFYPTIFDNSQFFREIKIFDHDLFVLPENYYTRAKILLEELNIEYKEDNILKDYAIGNLLKCFLITLQRAIPTTNNEKAYNILFSKLNLKIIENGFKIQKPSYYAKELQISTRALNSLIKENTGDSSGKYIRSKMIFEAQRLLCYTNQSVKEIAFDLGFDDITYFNRIFKKETNKTPLEFRKNHLELNGVV